MDASGFKNLIKKHEKDLPTGYYEALIEDLFDEIGAVKKTPDFFGKKEKELREVLKGKTAPVNFWARAEVYEPFTMGGPLRKHVRYKLKGFRVSLDNSFEGYAVKSDSWNIYESFSGGFFGSGRSMVSAIKTANKNISITPDLADQVKKSGPVMELPERDTEEVLKMLKKNNTKKARK